MNASPQLQTFLETLRDPSLTPDRSIVESLAQTAPWFSLPAAIRLQRAINNGTALDSDESSRLQMRVALSSPSGHAMAMLADRDSQTWAAFYPADDTPSRPDTCDAITTFLETYGHGDTPEDDALLERLIFNPQPDYASVLEEEYGDEAVSSPATDEQTALIDAFLAKPHRLEPEPATAPPQPAKPVTTQAQQTTSSDPPLSESLAKIYIRQQRYDKAYEIISNLNLNFHEKSAYFADQMRFLQKLMLNRRYSKPDTETK